MSLEEKRQAILAIYYEKVCYIKARKRCLTWKRSRNTGLRRVLTLWQSRTWTSHLLTTTLCSKTRLVSASSSGLCPLKLGMTDKSLSRTMRTELKRQSRRLQMQRRWLRRQIAQEAGIRTIEFRSWMRWGRSSKRLRRKSERFKHWRSLNRWMDWLSRLRSQK